VSELTEPDKMEDEEEDEEAAMPRGIYGVERAGLPNSINVLTIISKC